MRVTVLVLFLNLHPLTYGYIGVLILARGGSKGIYLKNLRQVGGISLLARTILTAKHASLEDITVSTDHPLIALEALKYGASVLKRSYITATDWAPSIWGVQEFIAYRHTVQLVVLLQATSPFTKSGHLKLSLAKLNYPKPYDCIFSVTRSFKLRWNWRGRNIYPVNFKSKRRPRRQDWSGEYIESGGFYIARSNILHQGYLQNDNCSVWEVSQYESLEIDSETDIRLANSYLSLQIV